ncbi:MAG TPA: hypothetical protein VGG19_08205 [Tepidisphaeraceae bacterium]|jgi:hypothetical protein
MKWKLILPSLLIFAVAGSADASVTTTAFSEFLVYGTDTFESSGGSVISTAQYVYWGGEIPADIADNIATDPNFSASDPAAKASIQSTASEAALTNDLDFLTDWPGSTSPLPDVFYTNASPTVFTGSFENTIPPGDYSAAFPAFTVSSVAPAVSIGIFTYGTGAMDSSGNIIDGTINFDTYEIDVVERPVPEPSGLGLMIDLTIIALAQRVRWVDLLPRRGHKGSS